MHHMRAGCPQHPERDVRFPRTAVVNCYEWVPEIEPWFSGQAARALNS